METPRISSSTKNSAEFEAFSRQHLFGAVVSLCLFVTFIGLGGYFFRAEIGAAATWISERFGWLGLTLLTLFGDSFPSPFPPDIALAVIAKGPLRARWQVFASLIVLASFAAGHLAYFWGQILSRQKWLPETISSWPHRHEDLVKKWGQRVVIIGALTPFPYSLACMSAGFVSLKYKDFFIATLWRIPRIVVFYLAIHLL